MNEREFLSTANSRELKMFAAMLVADRKRAIRHWWIAAGIGLMLVSCVLSLL